MKLKPLGKTGIHVTEICLGTMTWGVQNTEADAHIQLDYAVDAGINFIDTAELYAIPMSAGSYGKTETYIGNWFKKSGKRDRIVLATKIAGGGKETWIRNGNPPDKKSVSEAIEGSLKRLQTDYIDLYQIHWPHRSHYHFGDSWSYNPFNENLNKEAILSYSEELLDVLSEQIKQGKIRHIGLSNETVWGAMQWLRLSDEKNLPRVASIQNEYGLLQRHYDLDMAEMSYYEGVGLLAYSTLAGGVLTGKYLDHTVPKGSRADIVGKAFWRKNEYSDPVIRHYVTLAHQYNLDPAQLGIAFSLSRSFVTSVIIGATTLQQLEINIRAANLKLSSEILAQIETIHRLYPRPL